MKKFLSIFTLLLLAICSFAQEAYKPENLFLLIDEQSISTRTKSVSDFSEYVQRLNAAAEEALKNSPAEPAGAVITVAVRPEQSVKVWAATEPAISAETITKLEEALTKVPTCSVKHSVVPFAISASLWGGTVPEEMPNPLKEELENHELPETASMDDIINIVWPASKAQVQAEKKYILDLIDRFRSDKDLSTENLKNYADILRFAQSSNDVTVTIGDDSIPSDDQSVQEYGQLFLLSFIAGNVEYQLKHNEKQDAKKAGIDFEKAKYKQLKKINKSVKIKFLER